jgi:hypothetical protein
MNMIRELGSGAGQAFAGYLGYKLINVALCWGGAIIFIKVIVSGIKKIMLTFKHMDD